MNIWGPNLIKISSKSLFFVCIEAKTDISGVIFGQKSDRILIFRLYTSINQHFGCHFVHFFIFLLVCNHFEHI